MTSKQLLYFILIPICILNIGCTSLSREQPRESFLMLMEAYKRNDTVLVKDLIKLSAFSKYYGNSAQKGIDILGGKDLTPLGDLMEGQDSIGRFYYTTISGDKKIFYQVWCEYKKSEDGMIFFDEVNIVDLDYACKHHWSRIPQSRAEIKNLRWQLKFDGMTFNQAIVELWNKDHKPITGADFQIQFIVDGDIIYSKTISVNEVVQPGDLYLIQLNGLNDFYTGKKVTEENFIWNVRNLEVRPKEMAPECGTLESLQTTYAEKLKP